MWQQAYDPQVPASRRSEYRLLHGLKKKPGALWNLPIFRRHYFLRFLLDSLHNISKFASPDFSALGVLNECLRTAIRTSPDPKLLQLRWQSLLEYVPSKTASGHLMPPALYTKIQLRNDPDKAEVRVYKVDGQLEAAEAVDERLAQLENELGYAFEPEPVPEQAPPPTTRSQPEQAQKRKATGGIKTIIGVGKGGHQVDSVAHWFLHVADESCAKPEILAVFRKLRHFVELLSSPVFTDRLLDELKALSERIYKDYDAFSFQHQITMPPNWRRFMAIPDLIGFAGPPDNSDTRAFESAHVIMRSLHDAASKLSPEAQVLEHFAHRFVYLTAGFQSYVDKSPSVGPPATKPRNALPPHSMKFKSKDKILPAATAASIRRWYDRDQPLAYRFPSSTPAELELLCWDGVRAGGFTVRVGKDGKPTHATFLLRLPDDTLAVVQPMGFVQVNCAASPNASDVFVWGSLYNFSHPLLLKDLFSADSDLSHLLTASDPAFVVPIRSLDAATPDDAAAAVPRLTSPFADLLFWVDVGPVFQPGLARPIPDQLRLTLRGLTALKTVSAKETPKGRRRFCQSPLLSSAWATYLDLPPEVSWQLQQPPETHSSSASFPILCTAGQPWLEPAKTFNGRLRSFRGALISHQSRFQCYENFEGTQIN